MHGSIPEKKTQRIEGQPNDIRTIQWHSAVMI